MMKTYQKIIARVMDMLEESLPKELYYHSLGHTRYVIKVCEDYIERENIDGKDAELLRLAAAFHDAGFVVSAERHEEHGVELASDMLSSYDYSDEDIEVVSDLIMATKIPQSPNTFLERIICDADLDYLGRDNFYEISDKLYNELNTLGHNLDREDWNEIQIRFLEEHHYHTDYARTHLQPVKEKRLEELREGRF